MLRNEIRNWPAESSHPLGPRDSVLIFRIGRVTKPVSENCFGNPAVFMLIVFSVNTSYFVFP